MAVHVVETFGGRDEASEIVFYYGKLPYNKVKSASVLSWIIRSLMFHENVESFLRGEDFWEVAIED